MILWNLKVVSNMSPLPSRDKRSQLLTSCLELYRTYQDYLGSSSLSPQTRRAYQSRVNHFLVYVVTQARGAEHVFSETPERDLLLARYRSYLATELRGRPSSVNAAFTALASFYKFLGQKSSSIQREKERIVNRGHISKLSEQRLLEALSGEKKARNRALVFLLLRSGIKSTECVRLRTSDIQFEKRILIVESKHRVRRIPLAEDALLALYQWIKERSKKFKGAQTQTLFLNPQGKMLSTSALDLIVRGVGSRTNMKLSAKTLRHTYLKSCLEKGINEEKLADLAGFSRIDVAKRYREALQR